MVTRKIFDCREVLAMWYVHVRVCISTPSFLPLSPPPPLHTPLFLMFLVSPLILSPTPPFPPPPFRASPFPPSARTPFPSLTFPLSVNWRRRTGVLSESHRPPADADQCLPAVAAEPQNGRSKATQCSSAPPHLSSAPAHLSSAPPHLSSAPSHLSSAPSHLSSAVAAQRLAQTSDLVGWG